jgi:hypothetical protein
MSTEKPIVFTRHAKNALRDRRNRVDVAMIEHMIRDPAFLTPGNKPGRLEAWQPHPVEGWLQAAFVEEDRQIVVITLGPRRDGPPTEEAPDVH